MTEKTEQSEPLKEKWTWKMSASSDIPNEPEDHGKVFSEAPFHYRLRFAVNVFYEKKPTITIYHDAWHNERRRWIQQSASSYLLSTLKRLMSMLDEELKAA